MDQLLFCQPGETKAYLSQLASVMQLGTYAFHMPHCWSYLIPLDFISSISVIGPFRGTVQLLECAIYTNRCLMKMCESFLIFFEC